MAKQPTSDDRTDQHRRKGFKALVDSAKSNSYLLEDADGEYRYWKELSAEGKIRQIAADAVYYNVPFNAFAQEVRNTLGHLPPAGREEAALRVAFQTENEQHQLAKLLPGDDRIEPYPLIDRLRDALDEHRHTEAASAPGEKPAPSPGTVHFKGFSCELHWKTYPTGRPALYLVDVNTRETVTIATTDLPGVPLNPGEVFIKDHSENRGMLAALEKAGIVQATGETAQSGFVEVPVAKVLTSAYQKDWQEAVYQKAMADSTEQTHAAPAAGKPARKDATAGTLRKLLDAPARPKSSPDRKPEQPDKTPSH